MKTTIKRSVGVKQTPRVKQMSGMFEVPPAATSEQTWTVDLDLPRQWNVGVIVGESGSGKTTVGRWLCEQVGTRLIGGRDDDGNLAEPWEWARDRSILDGFPAGMSIKDITGLLSSVGFSSPPAWLRPFHVLSNGQQFRVNLARTLSEMSELAVVDEFSSVVDRTVAQVGSAAVAKIVRRRGQKLIAVTCHFDVIDWLEPDWVYEPATNTLKLNVGPDGSRGSLWRRPRIELEIVRTDLSAWQRFADHHYLSGDIHRSSTCFYGLLRGQPAAFCAVIHFPHPTHSGFREHRLVCLPDFQGVGIGNAMSEAVASLFAATGKRYFSTTGHPAMIAHRAKSPLWGMIRRPSMKGARNEGLSAGDGRLRANSMDRLTASFRYVGPARTPGEARAFGISTAGPPAA